MATNTKAEEDQYIIAKTSHLPYTYHSPFVQRLALLYITTCFLALLVMPKLGVLMRSVFHCRFFHCRLNRPDSVRCESEAAAVISIAISRHVIVNTLPVLTLDLLPFGISVRCAHSVSPSSCGLSKRALANLQQCKTSPEPENNHRQCLLE